MKGGRFLEKYFAYAIYDYLLQKREEEKYTKTRKKFGELILTLEAIAKEAFSLDEREQTKKLLEQIIADEKYQQQFKEIINLCELFYFRERKHF